MTLASTTYPLAQRAAGYRPSPVRDVWDVSMRPGMISLAGGNPDLSVLPTDWLADRSARLIREHGLECLQYGSGVGLAPLLDTVAEVMAAEGNPVDTSNIQITAGSQMALELVIKILCDPGDVVLAEGPTYVGAIGVFNGLQVNVEHAIMDENGIVPGELAVRIEALRSSGQTVKALYTVPNFNNPTGITLSAGRRPEIVEICRQAGITIIEDNPYGMLSFSGGHLPSLHTLDPEHVVYLGSFSKIFSPGVRVGWAVAPQWMRRQLQLASEATTICASVLSQSIVDAYIREYDWKSTLSGATGLYAERFESVRAAMIKHLPAGTLWTEPTGGFFTWLTLPDGISTAAVLDRAIDNDVVFVPGASFYTNGQGHNQLRLAYSLEQPQALAEGVRRLGLAIAETAATPNSPSVTSIGDAR